MDLSPEFISVNMMAYSYLGGERYMAALERQGFDIPDFNQRVEMYEYAFEELENNGYEPVDFLVFAKKGTHSDNKVHGLGMTDNVIGFGPWVLSPIPGEVQVGFPFTNDYVERSVTKSHSFDYCENLFQLINGRLISNGKVSKKEIETLINCNFDQATARSRQISHLIEELYRLELIESTEDGFQFLKNKIPEGIIFLWNYQKEIKEMN